MENNDKPWNEKVLDALRQTGDSIRTEAQRLLRDLGDPANQERVKQGLAEMGEWAARAADETAKVVDDAAQRVNAAIAVARRRPVKKAAHKPSRTAKRKTTLRPAKKKKAKKR